MAKRDSRSYLKLLQIRVAQRTPAKAAVSILTGLTGALLIWLAQAQEQTAAWALFMVLGALLLGLALALYRKLGLPKEPNVAARYDTCQPNLLAPAVNDNAQGRRPLSRRSLLRAGTAAGAGLLFGGAASRVAATNAPDKFAAATNGLHDDGLLGVEGEVDHRRNRFNPTDMIDDWDFGEVSQMPDGRTLREYRMVALDQTIEVAPGVFFESWNYNGRVPGPSLRCLEGDRIRIEFVNAGTHPHTIHFHGIHAASMDGIPGVGAGAIEPGDSTVYEFDAAPFGCHLYHCHSLPLTRHIHKGLYGAFIVDPDPGRFSGAEAETAVRRTFEGARAAGVKEMVMVMNGFDTNFDGENEIYAINSIAFHYMKNPIRIGTDDDVRLYLINVTEFDPVNSLHLHANFFDYYDHGTTLTPTLKTIDTVMQIQAQRGILEFNFRGFEPGSYMFHAHQSEFAELGWMSFFEVVEGRTV